jgi:hypothetical protein
MTAEPTDPDDDARHRRGLKFRRREDLAVELFHEALAHLGDVARVDRVLVQLGRFYNPYFDTPIVDVATRRAVLEALGRGDEGAARQLLEDRLLRYTRPGDVGPA